MSNLTLAFGKPTLADRIFTRSLVIDIVLIAAGAALTAIAAQIAIPLWPVPLTLQTFSVLLVGTVLGPLRGALSMGLYLLVGVLGLPVFSDGASGSLFALTSGGFIIGFILAAALVGWLAQREWDRKIVGTIVAFLAGSAVMYAVGLPWLYFSLQNLGSAVWHDYLGYDSLIAATFGAGMVPFLLGDALKALLAGALLPLAWRGVRRMGASKE